MTKKLINLVDESLFPKQPPLTLSRVAYSWGALLLLLVVWAVLSGKQSAALQIEVTQLNSEYQQLEKTKKDLEKQLADQKPDPALQAKLETYQVLMQGKRALHGRLTDPAQTNIVGFSQSMNDLSANHHKDIALQKIALRADFVQFSGQTRQPSVVPAWLTAFERSTFLAGKTFSSLNMDKSDSKFTNFVVSSSADVEEIQP